VWTHNFVVAWPLVSLFEQGVTLFNCGDTLLLRLAPTLALLLINSAEEVVDGPTHI
jgi:hypothetical protein